MLQIISFFPKLVCLWSRTFCVSDCDLTRTKTGSSERASTHPSKVDESNQFLLFTTTQTMFFTLALYLAKQNIQLFTLYFVFQKSI